MRKVIFIITSVALLGFLAADQTLSRKERKFAKNYLIQTRDGLLKDVKNLSDTQLNFKISPQKWSVAQVVEHITIAEATFTSYINNTIQLAPDPSRRPEVKVSDTTVIRIVTDRTHKSTAPEILQPHDKFASTAAALQEFVKLRDGNIKFIMTTKSDMRDHYGSHPIMGTIDLYQVLIQMAAHSRRHTLQIEEVMADPNFPKK